MITAPNNTIAPRVTPTKHGLMIVLMMQMLTKVKIINIFINVTLPSFDSPSRGDSLMDIHNPYSKDSLEEDDNENILNSLSFSDESMENKDLNHVHLTKLILSLKGYPLSNKPLITLKVCPSKTLKGEHSDSKDYHIVSQTYHTRNNPQPTTSLPNFQPNLPPPPCLPSKEYDLINQLQNNPARISLWELLQTSPTYYEAL